MAASTPVGPSLVAMVVRSRRAAPDLALDPCASRSGAAFLAGCPRPPSQRAPSRSTRAPFAALEGGGRKRIEEKDKEEEGGGDLIDEVAKYDDMGANVDATSTKPGWFWFQGVS